MNPQRLQRWLDAAIGVPIIKVLGKLSRKTGRPPKIERLLVIKLAAMGDTILLIPALRALRRALPDTKITWLMSAINRPIATTVPYVDEFIEWRGKDPWSLGRLGAELRLRRFDAVIDFEQWARGTAILSYVSGAPVRLGFNTAGQNRAGVFTDFYWKDFARHESHEFLGLAGMLTPVVFDGKLELWETDEGRMEVEMLGLKRHTEGPLVILHPGAGSDGLPREWPLTSYAVLGNWLMQKHGAELILTGGPEEKKKTADLKRLLNGHAVDLGGRVSWRGLVSLLTKTDLVISGNTGIMHMAAALSKRQVALHGPTNPMLWGPVNPNARVVMSPCPDCPSLRLGYEYHRLDQSCMAQIDVETVKREVEVLFDNPGVI